MTNLSQAKAGEILAVRMTVLVFDVKIDFGGGAVLHYVGAIQ
jgi:hypothetical protein